MQRGTTVLCDRFTRSTLAYQVGARKLQPEGLIEQMEAFARAGLEPDLTIYLDLDPTVGIARKQQQANHTMNTFDQFDLEFRRAVGGYFLQYATKHNRCVVVDANRSLTEVQFDINQLLDELYGTAG